MSAGASLADLPLLRRWASVLFTLSITLIFAVSPMALAAIGINYDSPGGAMWQKLHPATYICALAFTLNVAGQTRPMAFLKSLPARFPGASLFFISWILLISYALLVQHLPIAALIETYLVALVALLIDDDLGDDTHRFLRLFIHSLLFVNAVIGIFEFVTHYRLFPYVLSGEELTEDYRSTALLGHPLMNAGTSGAYALCLLLGADKTLATTPRMLLLGVQFLGLAAFGGRTSILMTGLIMSGILVKEFALILLGKRFDISRLIVAMFIVPVVMAGAIYAVSAGVFDDLIGRFVDDKGSAKARVVMLQMFDAFDITDLLIGPNPDVVSSKQRTLGIGVGIENTWIAMMFQYGAAMTFFFVIGLLALFWEFWRRSRPGATVLFLFFFVIITSAIGLSAKTTMFDQFALLLLYIFPKDSGDKETRLSSRRL
jgi:hypothetical protein